jgi:nitrate reductase NapA
VQVTNPGQSLPNPHELFEAKKEDLADKFLIVSDVYPTASTELADLVLPSAMWVEKNGMYGNSERRTQQWFKMVEPPGQARDDCWHDDRPRPPPLRARPPRHEGQATATSSSAFRRSRPEVPVWDYAHYYDVNVDRALFEEYRRSPATSTRTSPPTTSTPRPAGLRWPVVEQPDGSWRETRFRFAEFDDPYVAKGAGFSSTTPSPRTTRADLVPPYEPAARVARRGLPVLALHRARARALAHRHDDHARPQLRRAMPNAYVEMNPTTRSASGVATART